MEGGVTVAQTKAARRRNKQFYGKGPIGQPRYKRKSVAHLERREQQLREKSKTMAARKKRGK